MYLYNVTFAAAAAAIWLMQLAVYTLFILAFLSLSFLGVARFVGNEKLKENARQKMYFFPF